MKRKVELYNIHLLLNGKEFIEAVDNLVRELLDLGMNIPPKNKYSECYGYSILDPKIIKFDGYLNLQFRFVKRLKIKANQKLNLKKRTIVNTDETLDSDPSSIVIIRLLDHKMFFLREISRAPTASELEWSLRYLVTQLRSQKEKEFKQKNIFSDIWQVNINALVKKEDIRRSLGRLKVVKELRVLVHPRNNENPSDDSDDIAKHLDEIRKKATNEGEVVTATAIIKAKNRGSLKHEVVEEEALKTNSNNGLYDISIIGKDENGNRVVLDKDEIAANFKVEYDKGKTSFYSTISQCIEKYEELLEEKLVPRLNKETRLKNIKALEKMEYDEEI